MSQAYAGHPGLSLPSPTPLILPIRGHTSIILLSEVALGGTERMPLLCACAPHTRAAAVAAAKSSLAVPFGRLLLLRVLFLLLLLPLATFFGPC